MKRSIPLAAVAALLMFPMIAVSQPPGGGQRGVQHGGQRGGPPGGGQRGGGGGFGGGGGSPLEMISQIFDRADANQDGQLSKQELTAAMEAQTRRGPRGEGRGGPPPRPNGERERGGLQQDGRGPEEHGRGGPPPRPGQVLPDFLVGQLNLTVEQKKQLSALQENVDAELEKILTAEQRQQLESPPRVGPPSFRQRGGPPRGQNRGGSGDRRPKDAPNGR